MGLSLVETLVSMALLGAIFIPLLFVSSAVFLGQLVQMREQVDVSHNGSQFLGRVTCLLGQLFGYGYTGYSLGFNLEIPIRNRAQQGAYARAVTEQRADPDHAAGGVDLVLAEGLEHHLFLGRVLGKVRS